MNILKWLSRHHGACVLGLTIIVFALSLVHLWRLGFLSPDWLSANKDSLSALSSITTITIISTGAVFSYYSFFRGRTFSLRAQLELTATLHKTSEDDILQAYSLVVTNVGTSTIWNPQPTVRMVWHGQNNTVTEKIVDYWIEETHEDAANQTPIIEPAEKAQFFGQYIVPKEIWAVTYHVTLSDDSNHNWSISKTVSNET
ncbi:hypothetical protein [Roseibium album]|uniref:hypothetical protein n=1 Tax=Roseibium album TaxID=311410 RepID=UPI003298AF44